MRWKTHRALALFSYSAVIAFTPSLQADPLALLGVITAYRGATLPDRIELKGQHRTYGHSAIYALAFCVFTYLMGVMMLPLKGLAYGYICGVLSHLLADAFTDNGIPAFWPLDKRRIRPGRLRLWYYRQGKSEEEKVTMVAWLMTVVVWIKLLPSIVNRWIDTFFSYWI
ncbi:MAG: metal-dependent hydrolase [Bacillota bacterium]|nr:metal-dependent hydrolase [Bacillota bacterium]